MGSVILLSGPVGAGKTTVATELVSLLPGPVACIEGDKFWSFIAKGGGSFERNKNFKTIMASMVIAAIPYVRAGYDTIVDFSIPPWFLDKAGELIKSKKIPLNFVVIRPGIKVCAQRATLRDEGKISEYKYYRDLYDSFDMVESRHIIHDDKCDAAACAMRIATGLESGLFLI